MAPRCSVTCPEALDALDGYLQDADRWALRQTCAALRSRPHLADRTRLSLRQRPELLPHAIDRGAVTDGNRRQAVLLCADLGDVPSLARLIAAESDELKTVACLIAAKAGRPEVLRYVRGLERAAEGGALPWGASFAHADGSRTDLYNVIDVAVMYGHTDVAELARLEGCPLTRNVPLEACINGNVAALEWYFTHALESAAEWNAFLTYISVGHERVLDWAAARGLDLDLGRALGYLQFSGEAEKRDALLRWMARHERAG